MHVQVAECRAWPAGPELLKSLQIEGELGAAATSWQCTSSLHAVTACMRHPSTPAPCLGSQLSSRGWTDQFGAGMDREMALNVAMHPAARTCIAGGLPQHTHAPHRALDRHTRPVGMTVWLATQSAPRAAPRPSLCMASTAIHCLCHSKLHVPNVHIRQQ
jgi:hypothetical protein